MTGRRDIMRGTITIMLLGLFFVAMAALFKWSLPEGNENIVTYMAGQLSGFLAAALAFYFNTTQASSAKNETIARLSDTPREVTIKQPPDEAVPVEPVS